MATSSSSFDRNAEETLLARYLVNQVCGKASGRLDDECLYNPPHDVYFIGNLRPRSDDVTQDSGEPAYLRELLSKLAPVAFGADFAFLPTGDGAAVDVAVSWSCYFRVLPTLTQ